MTKNMALAAAAVLAVATAYLAYDKYITTQKIKKSGVDFSKITLP